MIDRDRPVTIVGAGIAGLTAALCLARRGFSVEIYERSPTLGEVGAGLQLSPNALRVLFDLGLSAPLESVGVLARSVSLRSGRSGRVIADIPVLSRDGTPYLSILRSDLQSTLLAAIGNEAAITLRLGTAVSKVRIVGETLLLGGFDASGDRLELRDRQIVICADGVRSGMAAALGLAAATPTGLVAWRAMVEPSEAAAPGIQAWLGRGHHAVAYPVSGGRLVNLVAIGRGHPDTPLDPALLARHFESWDRSLRRLIERAGPVSAWPLLEADRMDAIPPDGFMLLGDAAHAMLPFAAQGAAMAIEDAAVAADAVARGSSPGDAGRRYRAARMARIARVRRRVAFHRRVYHLPWPFGLGRDLVLGARSGESLARDLAWLYDWRPPAADVRTSDRDPRLDCTP